MAGRGVIARLRAMLGVREARTEGTELGSASSAPCRKVSTKLKLAAKVRPAGDPDAKWVDLCKTPGTVSVPVGQELLLEPGAAGSLGDAELKQLAVDFVGTNLTELNLNIGLLAHVTGVWNMTGLALPVCTSVTDIGLAHLTRLKSLTKLDLGFTGVTDAGLVLLTVLPNLTTLWLVGTGVTDTGIAFLRERLPGCQVWL